MVIIKYLDYYYNMRTLINTMQKPPDDRCDVTLDDLKLYRKTFSEIVDRHSRRGKFIRAN